MSKKDKELKNEDDTSSQDAQLEEEKTEQPEVVEDDLKKTQPGEETDYESELSKLKEERDNYKEGLIYEKAKNKTKEGDIKGMSPDEIANIATETVKKQLEDYRLEDKASFIKESVNTLASNDKEAELIKFIYDNKINKSGYDKQSISNDLEDAKILANKQSLIKENEELKRSLANKPTNNSYGSSEKNKPEIVDTSILSKDDLAFLKSRGKDPKEFIKKMQEKRKF